jgi:hypothetical protein
MPSSYPTGGELQAYLSAKGYGTITLDEANRLVGVAVRRWESEVGVRPYLGTSLIRTYAFPTDSIETGTVLDLTSLPLLSASTIKLGSTLGDWPRTLTPGTDFLLLPLNSGPYTSIRFLCAGATFVQITGIFGLSLDVPEDVYDAVLCFAAALFLENSQGSRGPLKRVVQGSVTMEYGTPSTIDTLKTRFGEVARARRFI